MKKLQQLTIGILAIQGSREEHEQMLQSIKKPQINTIWVNTAQDLDQISGLIMPGGESTAIGKLLKSKKIYEPLRQKINEGLPVWGTCAGAILLANKGSEYSLKVLDIAIERNAFGRQLDSFIEPIAIPQISPKPIEVFFIRAPRIKKVGSQARVLASLPETGEPIMVQQKNILASTFHPELGSSNLVHEYFAKICVHPL
jgi:5'-phosphate synthase pdxT subunit